jgi:hypothetical protein
MLMTGGDLAAADKPSGPVDVIIAVPISFLVVLFSFMLSFNLFGFSVYHLLLITRNLTTHEKVNIILRTIGFKILLYADETSFCVRSDAKSI